MSRENSFRLPLTTTTDSGEAEYLQVTVDHQKGGRSFMSGQHSERGVYITFTVCHGDIDDHSRTCFMVFEKRSGKLLIHPAARKSPKKIATAYALAEANKDKLRDLWEAKDWRGVFNLLEGTAEIEAA
jgi:hypothetical protein